jgi:hypothetical protein
MLLHISYSVVTEGDLWEQTNADPGMIEGQVKIDENSMIQITRVLNEGRGQTEDFGQTTGYFLEILYEPADIAVLNYR